MNEADPAASGIAERNTAERSMVDKAFALLRTFRPTGELQSLSDMARRAQVPKATAFRLANQLVALRLLERVGDKYVLGLGLLELGELVPTKHRLRPAALPFMQDLYEATHETVHLGIRDGHDVIYVEKIQGHFGARLPSRVGGRLPLTCTGVGKALLAFEDHEMVEEVVSQPLRRLTSLSITDPVRMMDELGRIRVAGVAYDREEAAIGNCCVAAPVIVNGAVVAAMSLTVPVGQFQPERLAPAVATATRALSRRLEHSRSALLNMGLDL